MVIVMVAITFAKVESAVSLTESRYKVRFYACYILSRL